MNNSNTVFKPHIEVFMIGSPVIIGDHIEAKILSINIKEHNYITYQVVWWSGNERKTEWLEQCEVHSHKEQATIKVGFSHYG